MINIYYRFEFKYRIPLQLARVLESELRYFGMVPDDYAQKAPEGSYTVTSIYLDSLEKEDFDDKMGGFLDRKKIRARIYEPYLKNSPVVWLEMKKKHDVSIAKERVSLTIPEWKLIEKNGAYATVAREKAPEERGVFENIAYFAMAKNAEPQTIIRYNRRPLVYKHVEEIRVTFDSNIEAANTNTLEYDKVFTPVLPRDQVVFELKFRTILPVWLRDLIEKFNLRRGAYSKYGYGVEALNRYIPIPR